MLNFDDISQITSLAGADLLELEIMRLRNEINKIGVNINQIVKNNNSHIYKTEEKRRLENYLEEVVLLQKTIISYMDIS